LAHFPLVNPQASPADRNSPRGPSATTSPFTLQAWPWLPAAIVGTLLMGWAYAPNFRHLISIWNTEPNYSHGFLVIPIAVMILWRRLSDWNYDWTPFRAPVWSWVLLGACLLGRAVAYEWSMQWVETVSILPVAACLVFALGGWPLLARAWPAVAFLVFMFPLPTSMNALVSLPLQRIATKGSCFVMQLTGLWVVAEGNVITLGTPHGPKQLEVAMACNGLSMLMTLAATVTATVILIDMPVWKRIVILLSAFPIALISNVARIVATGWCYYYIEGARAKELAHDWSGYLMMPLALVLVGLEIWILSWLFEADDENTRKPMGLVGPRS
jgi:exosortase